MNNSFEKNIIAVYKDRGSNWLSNLSNQVLQIADQWHLKGLKPFDNLSFNYTLHGYQHERPIVLKLGLELENEMLALKGFADFGAISVLDYQSGALLLDRAVPGKSLKGHPKAIEIACQVIKRLNQAPIPKHHSFPHVTDWLSTLDKPWDIPSLTKARQLKTHLLKLKYPQVLLHGDLHQDNILSHGDAWRVIDPKGVIGFPINETWACIENPELDLKYIAHFFNYPLDEVVQWYYVHLILAACWQLEDNLDPSLFLNLAKNLDI